MWDCRNPGLYSPKTINDTVSKRYAILLEHLFSVNCVFLSLSRPHYDKLITRTMFYNHLRIKSRKKTHSLPVMLTSSRSSDYKPSLVPGIESPVLGRFFEIYTLLEDNGQCDQI